jgi:hypothetical protein
MHTAHGTHWIGTWVDTRPHLVMAVKKHNLSSTMDQTKVIHLSHSLSLYWMNYSGSVKFSKIRKTNEGLIYVKCIVNLRILGNNILFFPFIFRHLCKYSPKNSAWKS